MTLRFDQFDDIKKGIGLILQDTIVADANSTDLFDDEQAAAAVTGCLKISRTGQTGMNQLQGKWRQVLTTASDVLVLRQQ